MAPRDVPQIWAELLTEAKFVDPRNDMPSMNKLAQAAGVHTSTISAMMHGDRETKAENINAVADALADALRVTDEQQRYNLRRNIHSMVGRALRGTEPFIPHQDADLLTPLERKTVNELIRLLALSRKENARSETPSEKVSTLPKRGTKIESGREAARRKSKP